MEEDITEGNNYYNSIKITMLRLFKDVKVKTVKEMLLILHFPTWQRENFFSKWLVMLSVKRYDVCGQLL